MKLLLILSVFIIVLTSCHSSKSDNEEYDLASYETAVMPESMQSEVNNASEVEPVQQDLIDKKKIIKDGHMRLKVNALEETKHQIDALIKIYNGYYANESYNNTDYESSYNLRIRIPSQAFEGFISDIESGDGEVIFKEINARDVTEEFIDLETRLANKKKYLKRYNELLQKANTVKEILEIEEKVRRIEEEIESVEGRLKYMSDLVSLSTLNLTIFREKDYKYNPRQRDNFFERFKQSLSKGWFGFVDFLLFIVKLWPFWIILAFIIPFWRKFRKNRKAKKHVD